MANAYTLNYTLASANDQFSAMWKLTRTMLAAGWRFKASGNAQSSGSFTAGQTATAASITAYTSPTQTLTGLSNITSGSVGQKITISNAATGGNNGTFIILSVVSSSSVTVYNTQGGASSTDANNGSLHWQLLVDTALDVWGTDGGVNLTSASRGTGSGTSVVIAAASATTGLATISAVSGFTINSVFDFCTITGSAAAGGPGTGGTNNGNWRIVATNLAGTTVTVYAPGLVAETGNASLTITEQYGGADGSITTFAASTSGQNTVINFTTGTFNAFSTSDVGRYISILSSGSGNNGTYVIAQFISTNNVLLYGPAMTASDANNPTLQWVEFDPRLQGYPSYIQGTASHAAWWLAQGPTTMKIPIGANVPVGTFIRGENVTQTTTGAQGELLGVVTDTSGSTGFLVVAPRVMGTGVQASSQATYGWNSSANTDTVTGAFSGATVTTPISSTPIAYIREMSIWSNFSNSGDMYYQCVDQNPATESATTASTGRFSTMANTLSGVSSQTPPTGATGGNPTTNGFPTTGTYTIMGTGGPGTGTPQGGGNNAFAFWSLVTPNTPGKAHLLAANNIEQQGVSQDGTWFYLQSANSLGYEGQSFLRLDNQEDGDLDPYVHQGHYAGGLNASPNRTADTANTQGSGSTTDNMNTNNGWFNSTADHGFKGFRRRGLSGETFNYFSVGLLYDIANASFLMNTNSGNPDQVGTAVATTYVREPFWLYLTPFTNQLASGRMRKGTPRWLHLCQGGTVNATFDTLEWVVLSSNTIQFVAGPWDGATTPSF